VDLKLGVTVKRIIKEGGRIAGVVVEQDGEEVEVAAKAVIVGSGGYANNKEWIKKYAVCYDKSQHLSSAQAFLPSFS
jgi:fumarate reductase flavoprotein subunit